LNSEGNYADENYDRSYFWTTLDIWLPGTVKTISGQFKKSDLCSEHRLNVSTSIVWRFTYTVTPANSGYQINSLVTYAK
jgi:hypothetical protein